MRFLALATDYDGTLAKEGRVSDEALAALERLAETGRKLLLVTGRELPDLEKVFPRLDIFDRIVAENGALLYTPGSHTERELAKQRVMVAELGLLSLEVNAAAVERLIEQIRVLARCPERVVLVVMPISPNIMRAIQSTVAGEVSSVKKGRLFSSIHPGKSSRHSSRRVSK